MTSENTPGREPVQIVEIQQPLCSRFYGTGSCTATGTDDERCYNTRATCQDPANYELGTPLSLYFGKGLVAEQGLVPYLIPSLVSVSTAPARLNIASSSPDSQGLGLRALCNIQFKDHQHTDRNVDPYLAGRSWNPLDRDRGSFWTRWIVRNRYRQNITIKVYDGYAGQTLGEMVSRTYFLQSVSGPDSSGRVTIQGKDILAKLEERKAQAPIASPGVLFRDISAAKTSFEVAGAVEDEYSETGTLRIGDELMTYAARATSDNGLEFTGVVRGTDGTTASDHDFDDTVQECLRYTEETPDAIVKDLLETFGGIPSAYLDSANWATEVEDNLGLYALTGIVTEPTSVSTLVSEIQQQSLVYIWWDERDALVKLKAVRGSEGQPPLLTDAANVISGSLSMTEKPSERASQVWIYYNQTDYTRSNTDPSAYASTVILADLESETDLLYGEASIRKIYARWLRASSLANNTATTIIRRYVDTPSELKLRVDAKDRGLWVADTFRLSHYLDVDQYGNRRERSWTIISAEEVVAGEVVEYTCADTTAAASLFFVMAAGADYPGYDVAPAKNCYIGDAAGLLSDGETAGRIS